jgi:hypothetical protein
MTTPSIEGDSRPVPSAVLAAKIDFLIQEFRDLRRGTVPRGEYDIARAADLARLAVVEAQIKSQSERRWQFVMAVASAALALVTSIVAAVTVATH